MDKTTETAREALIPGTEREIISFDSKGNFKCSRCGWTHSTTECAEYRLVQANLELEKVAKFVHMSVGSGQEGESPVDTLIRGYQIVLHNLKIMKPGEHAEVTEMMEED